MSKEQCPHGVARELCAHAVCAQRLRETASQREAWRKAYLTALPTLLQVLSDGERSRAEALTIANEMASDAAENFIEADKRRWGAA